MKIRNGFVSNSSSSSYIVTIKNTTSEEFYRTIAKKYYWDSIFSKGLFLEHLNNSLFFFEEFKLKHDDEWSKNRVSGLKEKIEKVNNIDGETDDGKIALLIEYLNYQQISVEQNKDSLVLTYFTSMHNSYENMHEFFKEIVLYYSFDTDKEISYVRESDNDKYDEHNY